MSDSCTAQETEEFHELTPCASLRNRNILFLCKVLAACIDSSCGQLGLCFVLHVHIYYGGFYRGETNKYVLLQCTTEERSLTVPCNVVRNMRTCCFHSNISVNCCPTFLKSHYNKSSGELE